LYEIHDCPLVLEVSVMKRKIVSVFGQVQPRRWRGGH
jgi:hypothetical protein